MASQPLILCLINKLQQQQKQTSTESGFKHRKTVQLRSGAGFPARRDDVLPFLLPYSHSIVPGGLLVTSYTTLFTPFTSLMMRVAVSPRNFMSNW